MARKNLLRARTATKLSRGVLAGVISLSVATGTLSVQAAPLREVHGVKDPAAAPAGTYTLDNTHASIIARVGHENTFSYSTFRFGTASGVLTWDPVNIEHSQVDVTIDMASIESPVPKFAEELVEQRFLNAAQYPTAHFVSSSIVRTGASTGKIIGSLTFMGQTRPMTIDAELVGAGIGLRGHPVVGFTGTARIQRSAFGFSTLIPNIADEVSFLIDIEFDKST